MQDEWVVSRIFHKNNDVKKSTPIIPNLFRMNSIGDDLLDYSTLPPLMDPSYGNTNDDFKGTKSQSDGYYLPTFSINSNNQLLIKPEEQQNHRTTTTYDHQIPTINYNISNQSNLNNPIGNTLSQPQIRIQNPNFPFQKNNSDYLVHQNNRMKSSMPTSTFATNNQVDQAFLRAYLAKNNECKMEQFSSNHSQDTGLSNDTSSVVSKQNRALYEDHLEGPSSSVAPLSDLECLWDY